MAATERALAQCRAKVEELESVARRLSETVVQRGRELQDLRRELSELRMSGDEGMRSLVAFGRQLEEIRTQARGQATQIRLKALRDAADLVDRVSDVARLPSAAGGRILGALDDATPPAQNGHGEANANGVFDGTVHLDVGPLSDFSQLVALEDAAGSIGATSEISIKRFSQGRATLAMRLSEPVELLRELEERCDIEFKVRSLRDDSVVLDVDDDEE